MMDRLLHRTVLACSGVAIAALVAAPVWDYLHYLRERTDTPAPVYSGTEESAALQVASAAPGGPPSPATVPRPGTVSPAPSVEPVGTLASLRPASPATPPRPERPTWNPVADRGAPRPTGVSDGPPPAPARDTGVVASPDAAGAVGGIPMTNVRGGGIVDAVERDPVASESPWPDQEGTLDRDRTPPQDPDGGSSVLSLEPSGTVLSPGQKLLVRVILTNGERVSSVPFHVHFDPEVLSFVGLREGASLSRSAPSPVLIGSTHPQRPGDLAVGLSIPGQPANDLSGEIVLLEFEAIGRGGSTLQLDRASVRGSSGTARPVTLAASTVRVD